MFAVGVAVKASNNVSTGIQCVTSREQVQMTMKMFCGRQASSCEWSEFDRIRPDGVGSTPGVSASCVSKVDM